MSLVAEAMWGGWREDEIKANSAQLKLEFGLSLAILVIKKKDTSHAKPFFRQSQLRNNK